MKNLILISFSFIFINCNSQDSLHNKMFSIYRDEKCNLNDNDNFQSKLKISNLKNGEFISYENFDKLLEFIQNEKTTILNLLKSSKKHNCLVKDILFWFENSYYFSDADRELLLSLLLKKDNTWNFPKYRFLLLMKTFNFPYHKYSNEIYNLVMADKKISEDEIFIIGKYKVYNLCDSLFKFYDEEYFYNKKFKSNSSVYQDVKYALTNLGDTTLGNFIFNIKKQEDTYYANEYLNSLSNPYENLNMPIEYYNLFTTKQMLYKWKIDGQYHQKNYPNELKTYEECIKSGTDDIIIPSADQWYPPISDLYFSEYEIKLIKHQDSIYDGLIEDKSVKRDQYFLPNVHKALFRIDLLLKNFKDRDLPAKSFRKPDYKKGKAIYEYKLKHKLIEPFEE